MQRPYRDVGGSPAPLKPYTWHRQGRPAAADKGRAPTVVNREGLARVSAPHLAHAVHLPPHTQATPPGSGWPTTASRPGSASAHAQRGTVHLPMSPPPPPATDPPPEQPNRGADPSAARARFARLSTAVCREMALLEGKAHDDDRWATLSELIDHALACAGRDEGASALASRVKLRLTHACTGFDEEEAAYGATFELLGLLARRVPAARPAASLCQRMLRQVHVAEQIIAEEEDEEDAEDGGGDAAGGASRNPPQRLLSGSYRRRPLGGVAVGSGTMRGHAWTAGTAPRSGRTTPKGRRSGDGRSPRGSPKAGDHHAQRVARTLMMMRGDRRMFERGPAIERALMRWQRMWLKAVLVLWRDGTRSLRLLRGMHWCASGAWKRDKKQDVHDANRDESKNFHELMSDVAARAMKAEETCDALRKRVNELSADTALLRAQNTELHHRLAASEAENRRLEELAARQKAELAAAADRVAEAERVAGELRFSLTGVIAARRASGGASALAAAEEWIRDAGGDAEEWIRGAVDVKLPLSTLLCKWGNWLMEPEPRAADLRIDEGVGFCNASVELPMMLISLYRLAPERVASSAVDACLKEADTLLQAEMLLDALRGCAVGTAATAESLSHDDDNGNVPRQQLYATIFARALDSASAEIIGGLPRLIDRADDEEHPVRDPAGFIPDARVPPEEAQEWATGDAAPEVLVDQLAAADRDAARVRVARRAVDVAVRSQVLKALQGGEAVELTDLERRDLSAYCDLPDDAMDLAKFGLANQPPASGLSATVCVEDPDGDTPGSGAEADPAAALGACRSEVRAHYRTLRRIYKCYSNNDVLRKHDTLAVGMSRKEFERLLVDIGQLDPEATRERKRKEWMMGPHEVDKLWQAEQKNENDKMSPNDFVTSLCRVAAMVYTDVSEQSAMEQLMENDVLEGANYVNPAGFRQQIYQDAVTNTLEPTRPKLRKIFDHYRSLKMGGKMEVSRRNVLLYGQFTQLVADAGLTAEQGSQVNNYQLQLAFTKMLDEADEGAANFKQFIEILCVVAALLNPSPWIPLQIRLRGFLVKALFPPLKRLLRGISQKSYRSYKRDKAFFGEKRSSVRGSLHGLSAAGAPRSPMAGAPRSPMAQGMSPRPKSVPCRTDLGRRSRNVSLPNQSDSVPVSTLMPPSGSGGLSPSASPRVREAPSPTWSGLGPRQVTAPP